MQLAGVVREICGDLFADECAGQVRNLQAAFNRVVIGDGDVVHPDHEQFLMELRWVGIAVRKIEAAEEPFF